MLLLAGGASRRMGCDKRLLPLGGRPLAARAFEAAGHVGGVWVLVAEPADEALLGRHLTGEAKFVVDATPGAGPMAALAAALPKVPAPRALLVAVDLALVTGPFLARLAALAEAEAAGIVVPRADGRLQVTCAVYARPLAPALAAAVAGGEASLTRFVAGLAPAGAPPPPGGPEAPAPGAAPGAAMDVRLPPPCGVRIVEPAVWSRWPGAGRHTFAAVNTPADYERLKHDLG